MTTLNPFSRLSTPFLDLADLAHEPAEPTPWAFANLLAPGLTLLTGDAFSGKTSLAYHLMLRVALGLNAFDGASDMSSNSGRATFLGLDSSSNHLSSLAKRFLAAHPGISLPTNIRINNTQKPLTTEEGLQELYEEFISHPDQRLFVIDNLTSLRHLFKGRDRKLFAFLRTIAESQQVCIMIVHTSRVTPSLVSAVDTHLHLKRYAISNFYQLTIRGKMLTSTTRQLYCPVSGINFRLLTTQELFGLTAHSAQRSMRRERVEVLRVFAAFGPAALTPSQIAAALDVDIETIKIILRPMVRTHLLVSPKRFHYQLSPTIKPLLNAILEQHTFLQPLAVSMLPQPSESEIQAAKKLTASISAKQTSAKTRNKRKAAALKLENASESPMAGSVPPGTHRKDAQGDMHLPHLEIATQAHEDYTISESPSEEPILSEADPRNQSASDVSRHTRDQQRKDKQKGQQKNSRQGRKQSSLRRANRVKPVLILAQPNQ
ncbi:AAA family ATPase [Ktedonospora formicarum]|uniref:Uncharacterized protein n=1 Tax=Ktedonospora formicarum TaxID=2778364 RepID=A0A8J3I477_9CHLR|nr:AAA family ATPase [Ktedonospora formicarum]GHO46500.1 hypothetical protein KSX_46630 [Ktedonospora formicarum]